ncbi:P-loop NTPase fold protein [Pseudoalteromonas arctica]|nr:P-loop NTPase fold protein [Pseudoalteromonas arctica]
MCAITAAAITVFVSNISFVQQAYASWGSILNTSLALHYSFAFLAGIGIKLMLDKFYISHGKRSIGFSWRYPPVTISVLFGLLFIVGYVYFTYSNEIVEQLTAHAFLSFKFLSLSFLAVAVTIIYQTKLYTKNPIFSVVLCAVSAFYLFSAINLVEIAHAFCVFFCIAAAYLGMSIYLISEQLRVSNKELIAESKQKVEFKFESLEHFQKWFKDDLPVQSTTELEPDLQVYAQRITERLLTGGDKEGYERKGAQHIALCGPFGCGKSSIVDSIASELAKSPKQDGIWIQSDISTWGAASGSVAHVILSHIIDDISQHLDMCAFRALPKHYTEAMKAGGSFFQFASTLLAGPVDIEARFQKLNDVLEATNHKLLITLQDVDRGTGDENEKRLNDIAALLDRLKNRNLSHINFIVAMGNDKLKSLEVLSRATDYREDVVFSNFSVKKLESFILIMINEAEKKGVVVFNDDMNEFRNSQDEPLAFIANKSLELELISNYLTTFRILKKVLRRTYEAWTSDAGLMGEVNIYALLMLYTLREKEVKAFNRVLHFLNEPNYIRVQGQDLKGSLEEIAQNDKNIHHFIVVLLNLIEIGDKYDFDRLKDYLQGIHSPKYLHRALKQNVDKIDSDQNFIETLKDVTQSKDLLSFVKYWLETDPFQEKNRIAQFIFCDFQTGKLNLDLFQQYKNRVGVLKDSLTRRVAFYIASRLTIESFVAIEQLLLINGNDESLIKSAKRALKVALIEVLTDNYDREYSEIQGKTFESELPRDLYAFTRAAYDVVKSKLNIRHDISIPEMSYKNAKNLNEEIEKQKEALSR